MTGLPHAIVAAWAYAVDLQARKADAIAQWHQDESDRWLAFAWVPVQQDGVPRPTPATCLRRARTSRWRAGCAHRDALRLRGCIERAGEAP